MFNEAAAAAVKASGTPTMVRAVARGARYLAGLVDIDSPEPGGVDVSGIAEAIEAEFTMADTLPLGLVARCHLGSPYEVHVLDMTGHIIEHYYSLQAMPQPFERARTLALHDAYAAIEVYSDRMVCVRPDGTTAVVNH